MSWITHYKPSSYDATVSSLAWRAWPCSHKVGCSLFGHWLVTVLQSCGLQSYTICWSKWFINCYNMVGWNIGTHFNRSFESSYRYRFLVLDSYFPESIKLVLCWRSWACEILCEIHSLFLHGNNYSVKCYSQMVCPLGIFLCCKC